MITEKLYFIQLRGTLNYNYNNYLNNEDLYINGRRKNPNFIGYYASVDGCESEYIEYNVWPEIKFTFKIKAIVNTESKAIVLPLGMLINIFDDKTTIRSLAIIDHYEPEICYEFFSKGEKYGKKDSTIVTKDNTLIKSIFFKKDNLNISPKDFVIHYLKSLSETELDQLVKLYFEHIENIRLEEDRIEMEKYLSKNKHENKSIFNDEYYNDNLDLDQQGPEFWDNI